MKLRFVLFLTFCFCSYSFSQLTPAKPFIINGQVIDSTEQKGIPFATVTVYKQPNNEIEKRFATDVDGNFSVKITAAGNYKVTMQSISFETLSKAIELKENHTLNLGKIILKDDTKEIEAVQVTTLRPLVKMSIDKITYNSESDPDAKTATVLDMLRKVPLVTVDGEDNIKLKGGTNFKIFMNGKPSAMLNNNAKDVLKSMPASAVKDIEVITSPGAKYDAEGIGGIINLITEKKSLDGYTGTVRANYNTQGSSSTGIYVAVTKGKFSVSTNLNLHYYERRNNSSSSRENFTSTDNHYIYYNGNSLNKNTYMWGEGQASYELDTLNLISASFNLWGAQGRSNPYQFIDVQNDKAISTQQYTMNSHNKYMYGGPEGNIDYQHIFKQNKEQILTFSYKINYNPTNNNGISDMNGILNFTDLHQKSDNKAYSTEQTFQADYVHPLTANQKIESGLKGIIRQSSSNTDYYVYINNQFELNPARKSDFDYTQNIYAAYTSYDLTINKLGLKAGVRAENSYTDGKIITVKENNFTNKSLEFVPSASVSYQLKPSQSLKTSYNMSIQRPGIWYLNPYVNDIDPKNISYGNPNLNPEKYHNLDLSFSNFAEKVNLNISAYYSFCENSIENITTVTQDTSKSTYYNIGKRNSAGLSLYGSLKIGSNFNISSNSSVNYSNTQNTLDEDMKNSGWGGNVSLETRYTIGKGYRLSVNGGYYFPYIELQSKSSAFYYTNFTINKELLNKKMNISLSARNIFWKTINYEYKTFGKNFYQNNIYSNPGQTFSFSISYRFGEMNKEVKKAQRGISNDDVKSGGKGSGGGN